MAEIDPSVSISHEKRRLRMPMRVALHAIYLSSFVISGLSQDSLARAEPTSYASELGRGQAWGY